MFAVNLSAEEPQAKLNWVNGGNCWAAAPGFLYCGERHPHAEGDAGAFVSFVCFEHYQAVLLGHGNITHPSNIRTVDSDFGHAKFSNVWVAAAETETFMSNNVDPGNEGYFNLLRGLSNSQASRFEYSITPGDIHEMIELTGEEQRIVLAYVDLCAEQVGQ